MFSLKKYVFYPVHVDLVPLEVVLGRVQLGDDATEDHGSQLIKQFLKYIIEGFLRVKVQVENGDVDPPVHSRVGFVGRLGLW